MYNVYGLRQGPNVGVRPKADKNFYLWLTVEKIHAFAFFTKKHLWPYGCSGSSFTAAVVGLWKFSLKMAGGGNLYFAQFSAILKRMVLFFTTSMLT